MSADKSLTFPLQPDGRWHEYQVSRKPQGKWRGTLRIQRLDLGAPEDTLEADWVRLYGGTP